MTEQQKRDWREGNRRLIQASRPELMEDSPFTFEESGWAPAAPTTPFESYMDIQQRKQTGLTWRPAEEGEER